MKKVLIGVLSTVVIAGAALAGVYFLVPEVKEKVNDTVENLVNKIKGSLKSDGQKNEDRIDQIKEDDRYKELDNDGKEKFEEKFDQIANSDEYKNLSEKEKTDLIDKLVESEKLQQDIKNEEEKQKAREEELLHESESLLSQKQELEQQIQNSLDAGVSEEEISAMRQQQENIENQITAIEQEQKYFETIDTVINSANNMFNDKNEKTSIKKIYGIYKLGGFLYIYSDIVKTEEFANVEICSISSAFCRIMIELKGNENYEDVLDKISTTEYVDVRRECINKNAESHKEFFENNKYSIDSSIKICESKGYSFSVVESWENGESGQPEFIIKRIRNNQEVLRILTYSNGQYSSQPIEKICPEFWAQKELEENKQNAEAESSAVEEFVVCDQDGNVTGFDWNAYRASKDQNNANTQTSTETVKQVNKLYDDLELGL